MTTPFTHADQFTAIKDCEHLGGQHALIYHNDQSKTEAGLQVVPFTCSKCGTTGRVEIWPSGRAVAAGVEAVALSDN
jgi:hypothetical protein